MRKPNTVLLELLNFKRTNIRLPWTYVITRNKNIPDTDQLLTSPRLDNMKIIEIQDAGKLRVHS